MQEVDDFVGELEGVGWPALQHLRPGLSEAQLMDSVQEHMPWWVEHVDEAIVSWYGWQNGIDDDAFPDERAAAYAAEFAPDGSTLVSHDWFIFPEALEILGHEYFRSLGVVFPIAALNFIPHTIYLRKLTPGDEWTVWYHQLQSDFTATAAEDRSAPAPTFREWLGALTNGLRSGDMGLTGEGSIGMTRLGRRDCLGFPWDASVQR